MSKKFEMETKWEKCERNAKKQGKTIHTNEGSNQQTMWRE